MIVSQIIQKTRQLLRSEAIRYLIAGGLTTLVNLLLFYLFTNLFNVDVTLSNVASIIIAIIFAFFINKFYVFGSDSANLIAFMGEFLRFIAGRLLSMTVEVGGVYLLYNILSLPAMSAKIIIQVAIVILNYVLSKFFVFQQS